VLNEKPQEPSPGAASGKPGTTGGPSSGPEEKTRKRNPRAGKPPAFQFYPADFLADEKVAMMSVTERGIYVTLLAFGWREGSIPADEGDLVRLLRCSTLMLRQAWGRVGRCFAPHPEDPGRLINPRQESDRCTHADHVQRKHRAGVQGGRKSAEVRRQMQALVQHPSTSSSASASASAEGSGAGFLAGSDIQQKHTSGQDKPDRGCVGGRCAHGREGFEAHWSSYPRKVGRKDAERHWCSVKACRSPELRERIAQALARDLQTWQARGTPIDKIKHGDAWLYAQPWLDEGEQGSLEDVSREARRKELEAQGIEVPPDRRRRNEQG